MTEARLSQPPKGAAEEGGSNPDLIKDVNDSGDATSIKAAAAAANESAGKKGGDECDDEKPSRMQQQKDIEEENKRRKQLLANAIAER